MTDVSPEVVSVDVDSGSDEIESVESAESSEEVSSDINDDFDAWLAKRESKPSETKEEEVEPEPEEQPAKKVEETPKTIKYKVDGEEREISLDEVPTLLSKAAGADKRFQEASSIRKEAIEFVDFLKSSPIDALKRAGIDFEELAINHVHELIQIQQMSPEQREAYELRKENETYKQKEARLREEAEQRERIRQEAEQEEETNRYIQSFEQDIISVMEANPDIPRNTFVVSRFAFYMQEALKQGIDVKAAQCLDYVMQDLSGMIKQNNNKKVVDIKQNIQNPKVSSSNQKSNKKPAARFRSLYDMLDEV